MFIICVWEIAYIIVNIFSRASISYAGWVCNFFLWTKIDVISDETGSLRNPQTKQFHLWYDINVLMWPLNIPWCMGLCNWEEITLDLKHWWRKCWWSSYHIRKSMGFACFCWCHLCAINCRWYPLSPRHCWYAVTSL